MFTKDDSSLILIDFNEVKLEQKEKTSAHLVLNTRTMSFLTSYTIPNLGILF